MMWLDCGGGGRLWGDREGRGIKVWRVYIDPHEDLLHLTQHPAGIR